MSQVYIESNINTNLFSTTKKNFTMYTGYVSLNQAIS
jgi:hypothetical protein